MHTNNNFICLGSTWNYSCKHQQTALGTMSCFPSASDAWLNSCCSFICLPMEGLGSGRSPQELAAALNLGTAAVMAPVTHHQWAA